MKYNFNSHKVTYLSILLAGLLLGVIFSASIHPSPSLSPLPAFAADKTIPAVDGSAAALQTQFSSAVKRAMPAVVSIKSSKVVQVADQPQMDPFFRQFFGDLFPRPQDVPEQREQGLGSGVILSPDGLIVTNFHVVDGAQHIDVVLSDETEHKATVVGTDSKTDLALLKIDSKDLPVLPVDTTSSPDVGDIVFAIGNPFGVGQTVTMGIVSAKGRGNLGIEDYEDFIQTDAAINPGNSGGALINLQGKLVGINTAIIGRSGGNDGIGFAIPANMVEHVIDQIRTNGKVSRGYLGAYIQEVTPEISSAFHFEGTTGALISDVSPNGPAAQAGIQRGDIVTGINGEPVTDSRRLRLRIAEIAPGTTVELNLWRNGKEMTVPVTLGDLPDDTMTTTPSAESNGDVSRGLTLQELTPQIRRSLNLDSGIHGVVVSNVDPGSLAAYVGLARGDVIQEVNRTPISSIAEAQQAFQAGKDSSLLLLVNRGGNTLFVVLPASED